jgi:hypothetical protein
MPKEIGPRNYVVTNYWSKYYATIHCTICGNQGIIDSRDVRTPAGELVGRLNYCICPNGQVMRKRNAKLQKET